MDGAQLDAFTDTLAHRGPDGRGTWRDERAGIGLGHRRLAILDLSPAGTQPMSSDGGRYWITYNGEIYNFIEIRAELETKGYRFRTQTDTEVILAAYEEWGSEMMLRFNGMWAFAIFDSRERQLFFARDRFGIKPFYYVFRGDLFAFASELKAFRKLPGFTAAMDREYAQVFLQDAFSVEGTERTIINGVRRLQAGHSGKLQGGRLEIHRWWNTLDHLVEVPVSLEKQADEFGRLFDEAVRLRMRSDVPIGTCLSGGFDSASVVCTLADVARRDKGTRLAKDWQKAFVATFPGMDNDESIQAQEVVRMAGVEGHYYPIRDEHALLQFDQILFDFDDLYIGPPTAPWLIYRELRRNAVTVSLDGHGADELMGAYRLPDYLLLNDAPSWLWHPGENLRRLKRCFELMPQADYSRTLGGYLRRAAVISVVHHPQLKGLAPRIRSLRSVIWPKRRSSLMRRPDADLPAGFTAAVDTDQVPADWGPLNRELYLLFHRTMLPTILRNFDRLSMAHGIEVRMPFMDWRLVCFVMSLPEESKVGGGVTKRVAREAMRNRIPESIRTSKMKIGFNAPMPKWMAGPLRNWAMDLASPAFSGGHDLVNDEALRKMFESGAKSWNWRSAQEAWTCLNLLWFERRFFKR